MTYTFEEKEGRVLIYNARRKLVGSARRDADGALVVEYGENVMWLPIRDALERLDGAKGEGCSERSPMKKEENIPCGACMATLPAPEEGDWTTCPACGRGWELNSEHTGIKSVTLDVQTVSIDANSLFFRGVKNHG